MEDISKLLDVVTKAMGALGAYPLWVKVLVVLAILAAGVFVLRMAQGGLEGD